MNPDPACCPNCGYPIPDAQIQARNAQIVGVKGGRPPKDDPQLSKAVLAYLRRKSDGYAKVAKEFRVSATSLRRRVMQRGRKRK